MKWTKIESRKDCPRPGDDVLITDGHIVHVGWLETYEPCEEPLFFSRLEDDETNWIDNITHWMPLPKPPKQDGMD